MSDLEDRRQNGERKPLQFRSDQNVTAEEGWRRDQAKMAA
jgi:hypothetical protein